MAGYSLCTDQIDIPAGAKRPKISLEPRLKADVHLYSAVPHAYLCREFRLAATLPRWFNTAPVMDHRLEPGLAGSVLLCKARPSPGRHRDHTRRVLR